MKTIGTKQLSIILTILLIVTSIIYSPAQRTRVSRGKSKIENRQKKSHEKSIKHSQTHHRRSSSSTLGSDRFSHSVNTSKKQKTKSTPVKRREASRRKTSVPAFFKRRETMQDRDIEKRRTNSPTINTKRYKNNRHNRISSDSRSYHNDRGTYNSFHTIYRIDNHDRHYSPSKNYSGANRYWSSHYSPERISYTTHNSSYHKHYNHGKYKHWDHKWESYRWNIDSWKDYYGAYDPHAYRYHKYYYHHPKYGHVIRHLGIHPSFFLYNNIKYYSYNGHFFRHLRGVGYVLVDMPYGIVFNRLPYGYEKIYINGYLYFRIGNLFFERAPHGYALIHYPERYYAIDSEYNHDGFFHIEIHF